MNNPFKFSTIVDGEYFTDRVAEQEKVREILASENHLILISPRRFGKTSLVQKVTKGLSRPVFQLNLQLVTGTADFAARLLWIMLQQYPMERLEYLITHFHFIPTISTNPMTDGIEVSFQPSMDETDKKVLIGLAVEMRVPVFLFYKVSALILQVLPLAV